MRNQADPLDSLRSVLVARLRARSPEVEKAIVAKVRRSGQRRAQIPKVSPRCRRLRAHPSMSSPLLSNWGRVGSHASRRPGRRMSGTWLATASSVAESVSLAVGEMRQGIDGWRLTHLEAQTALVVMLRRPQRLVRGSDVALAAAAMHDDTMRRSLMDVYLGPD